MREIGRAWKDLVRRAIRAGIFNDLGSGSNVDICVIRANAQVDLLRNFETPNDQQVLREKVEKISQFVELPLGTTKVKSSDTASIWELIESSDADIAR